MFRNKCSSSSGWAMWSSPQKTECECVCGANCYKRQECCEVVAVVARRPPLFPLYTHTRSQQMVVSCEPVCVGVSEFARGQAGRELHDSDLSSDHHQRLMTDGSLRQGCDKKCVEVVVAGVRGRGSGWAGLTELTRLRRPVMATLGQLVSNSLWFAFDALDHQKTGVVPKSQLKSWEGGTLGNKREKTRLEVKQGGKENKEWEIVRVEKRGGVRVKQGGKENKEWEIVRVERRGGVRVKQRGKENKEWEIVRGEVDQG
ncbi:hypothetical protein Pcinc_010170 [Petrolisthes cinctipes]|uniref:SWAP70 N-terminal EF-hand domain-containing protein n=1 Tax=Petrolisthes cinctipes TaxID=88211 RepID=A0AAE1KVP7_PETCI|nr:hypothetical protein Pcinc_010170 [Petrolisthes cinctipes]